MNWCVKPGAPNEPSEPVAWRSLLRALGLRPREAAQRMGITERDVALLVSGRGHIEGPADRWDELAQRWVGATAEAMGRLFVVDTARAGHPSRPSPRGGPPARAGEAPAR